MIDCKLQRSIQIYSIRQKAELENFEGITKNGWHVFMCIGTHGCLLVWLISWLNGFELLL